jgi:hypothetical protein
MPLRLFDVEDAFGWCGRFLDDTVELSYHQREDLHAYLVSECWRISLEFDPDRGVYFSTFAAGILKRRRVDWLRKERGRTRWRFRGGIYERKLPSFTSLDADGPERDRLDAALGAGGGDPTPGRDPALARLLDDGGRRQARDYELLGLEAPR